MNEKHLIQFIIALVIVLAVICGCAAEPVKPRTWIEIEVTRPEYSEKLSQGVWMLFNNPQARKHIELIIMTKQWRAEDANNEN